MRRLTAVRTVTAAAVTGALLAPASVAAAGPSGPDTSAATAPGAIEAATLTPAVVEGNPPLKPGENLQERGTVIQVGDGDTFRMKEDGTGKTLHVRILGVQAPEVDPNTIGQCGGEAAKTYFKNLMLGKQVVLASVARRTEWRGRIMRTAYLKTSNGWLDVQKPLLEKGYGQWFPKKLEPVHNLDYRRIELAARAKGIRMWNPKYCGKGNSYGIPIDMWGQANPSTVDARNINGEYVRIFNRHKSRTLDLSRWVVRFGGLDMFQFPSGVKVKPGNNVKLHIGKGRNRGNKYYWGLSIPLLTNPTYSPFVGDGLFLLDRKGNVRSSFVYPCISNCNAPLYGKVKIKKVHYKWTGGKRKGADAEYVNLKNVSGKNVRLFGYELRVGASVYEFKKKDWLLKGQRMKIRMSTGKDQILKKKRKPRKRIKLRYLQSKKPVLKDNGDQVELRTYDLKRVSCRAYDSRGRWIPCKRDWA